MFYLSEEMFCPDNKVFRQPAFGVLPECVPMACRRRISRLRYLRRRAEVDDVHTQPETLERFIIRRKAARPVN